MAPRHLLVCIALWSVTTAACERAPAALPPPPPLPPAAPPPPPPPAPPPPPPPAPPPAPSEDPARFVAFDRANLRRHVALLAFARKARAQLEKASLGAKGPTGPKRILALQASQQPAIAAQAQALRTMDPQGDRSRLTAAHETNLQYLADEYPAAIVGALSGDHGPLDELRTEMDRVERQIEDWLKRVRQADTPAAGK